jgi:hypothetical protein
MNTNLTQTLSDSSKWTKDADAKDCNGRNLNYGSNTAAACWCLAGAIEKEVYAPHSSPLLGITEICSNSSRKERIRKATIIQIRNLYGAHWDKIESFNDHPSTTFEMIHKVCEIVDSLDLDSPEFNPSTPYNP